MINNEQKAVVKNLKSRWAAAKLAGNIKQANETMDLIYEWYLDNIGKLTIEQAKAFRLFFDRYDYI